MRCDFVGAAPFDHRHVAIREVLTYDPYDPMADPNRMLPILDSTTAAFQNFAKTCPSAFVRMAGMALRQRSVLTVNNDRYHIDTQQSDAFQRNTPDLEPKRTRFVNVFKGGKVPNDKSATCKVAD